MRLLNLAIPVVTLLTSCGYEPSDKSSEGLNDDSDRPEIDTQYEEEEPKEVVTEYRKEGHDLALVLDSSKELPTCDNGNQKQLVYLKDTRSFMSCEDGTWMEVLIKGDTGDNGSKGPKGDPGLPLPTNLWLDPITEKTWLIGGISGFRQYFQSACQNGYKEPSIEDVVLAVFHGIGAKVTTAYIWTSSESTQSADNAIAVKVAGNFAYDRPRSESSAIVCLYDPTP